MKKALCVGIVCLLSLASLVFAQEGGYASKFRPLDYGRLRQIVVENQVNIPTQKSPLSNTEGQRAANSLTAPQSFTASNSGMLDYAGLNQAVLDARTPTYNKATTMKSLEIHQENPNGNGTRYQATPASKVYAQSRKK